MLSRRAADSLTARVFDSTTLHGGCRLDAYREGDTYFIDIDLPGVDPATIDVTSDRTALTVRAERKHADHDQAEPDQAEPDQAEPEQAQREQAQREQAVSPQAGSEQARSEQAGSEQSEAERSGSVPAQLEPAHAAENHAHPDHAGLHLVGTEPETGACTREVALSCPMDTDRLDATYDAGVLTLRIPLAAQNEPREADAPADLAAAA